MLSAAPSSQAGADDAEVDFPALSIPPNCVDVLCKFCRRSKYLTPNTTVSKAQAVATNQLTIRWRRERGTQCAPCVNFQAKKDTPDEFRTHQVPFFDSARFC